MTMSDNCPRLPQPKRRKTKSFSTSKLKPGLTMTWPSGKDVDGAGTDLLPVEIYEAITSYLSRTDVQNMRLVSHDFERNICQFLFNIVVVPFRPEIYGIALDTDNALTPSSVMLQDQGMRVFQGFGQWIRRFAMSFEIDMVKLSNPPIKSDQEAITTFWGIYRWPFQNYNRYSQLEGLEQTADETRSMAKALRYITGAHELGLSIDGGLGWLSGPDVNQRVVKRARKLSVFGEPKFAPEEPTPISRQTIVKSNRLNVESRPAIYSAFERMLHDAGFRGENLEPSMRLMLESEETGAANPWEAFQTQSAPLVESAYANWRRRRPRTQENTPTNATVDAANGPPLTEEVDDDDEGLDDAQLLPALLAVPASAIPNKTLKQKDLCSLKPNELTTAQKEMLLEMEWAQNAFMQSWVIAVVDNKSTFSTISTLNIARLPSRHLPILSRKDFWDGLSKLEKLSLAIIPDWRDIRKDETTWVQDLRISPSAAIPSVFRILADHVAHRKNIKTLHFEWLCGGEYAPGLFSRNQLVLAAPVVSRALHMVNRAEIWDVLSLPHVKNLSFKNCWFSPHIMTRFLWPLKKDALESVSFDSVSLTAAIPLRAQPNPLTQAGIVQNIQNALANHAAQVVAPVNNAALVGLAAIPPNLQPVQNQPQPVSNQTNEPDWLQTPRTGSWAEIIEILTPGTTLAEFRYDMKIGPEPAPCNLGRLRQMSFTSCGYLRLPMDFDQTALENAGHQNTMQHTNITKRINDIDSHMMKPLDHFLGAITNHIPAAEVATLETAWGFVVGWRTTRPEFADWADLAEDALLDGAYNAGAGRFQGLIESPSSTRGESLHRV